MRVRAHPGQAPPGTAHCLVVHHLRQKIGVTFGNGEVTTGGNALKFYASLRLEIRRIGQLKEDDTVKGARTKITPVKNKMAPPFKTIEVDIVYGRGICPAADLLSLAESHEVVAKNGAWYNYGDEKLGQGKDNVANRLIADPALFARMKAHLLTKLGLGATAELPEAK